MASAQGSSLHAGSRLRTWLGQRVAPIGFVATALACGSTESDGSAARVALGSAGSGNATAGGQGGAAGGGSGGSGATGMTGGTGGTGGSGTSGRPGTGAEPGNGGTGNGGEAGAVEPGNGGTGAGGGSGGSAGSSGRSSSDDGGKGGSAGKGGGSTGGSGGGDPPAGTSNGCGKDPPFTGRASQTVTIDGTVRDYDVIVPDSYDSSRPMALVFEFHASGGTIDTAIGSGLGAVPGADTNAIFVYPQAIVFPGYGVGWDEDCASHDVPLVDAGLEFVEENFCVATDRVFTAGFSWGGDFANAMACCRPDVLRAVASASGGEWGAELGVNQDCGSTGLTGYRLTYGGKDDRYPGAQFDLAADLFVTANGCGSGTDPASPSPCVSYRDCQAPVIVCEYPDLGHEYPPGWAADTWDFFASFE